MNQTFLGHNFLVLKDGCKKKENAKNLKTLALLVAILLHAL